MSGDPNKKSPRTFMCRDALWERFEQMARELECSVDYLINDAMKQYARQRNYATDAGPPSAAPPAIPRGEAREAGGMGGMGGYRPASMPPGLQPANSASRLPPPPNGGRSALPAPPPSRAASNLPPPAAPPPTRTLGNMAGGLPAPPPTRAAYAQTMQSRMQPTPGQPMPRQEYPQPAGPSHAGRSAPPPPLPNGGYNQPTASAQLTVIYNGERIAVAKDRFVVGRGKQSSDLTLKDPNVSRQHAMIEFQNGAYFMVDMGSTNGVEFNGQRIARKQIAEGDIFRICDHEIRFTFR
ncbi:MAG: FHA domain-containing protein [Polyangiaceae bacterium]